MSEAATRAALAWAIGETVLRLPPSLRRADGWEWDADDIALVALSDDGEFRFHVAAERRGGRKVRIAIMSVADDDGSATWEAPLPAPPSDAQEEG